MCCQPEPCVQSLTAGHALLMLPQATSAAQVFLTHTAASQERGVKPVWERQDSSLLSCLFHAEIMSSATTISPPRRRIVFVEMAKSPKLVLNEAETESLIQCLSVLWVDISFPAALRSEDFTWCKINAAPLKSAHLHRGSNSIMFPHWKRALNKHFMQRSQIPHFKGCESHRQFREYRNGLEVITFNWVAPRFPSEFRARNELAAKLFPKTFCTKSRAVSVVTRAEAK